MRARSTHRCHSRGLSLVEVVLIIASVSLLTLVILPAIYAPRRPTARMSCANHVKSLSLAFRLYSIDHGDRFPVFSTNELTTGGVWEHELLDRWRRLSNEIGAAKLLICPADRRRAASSFSTLATANTSYLLNADAQEKPTSLLIGDRNLTSDDLPISPGVFTLSTNFIPGWTMEMHRGQGHLAFGDGSVACLAANGGLKQALDWSAAATNRLLVP